MTTTPYFAFSSLSLLYIHLVAENFCPKWIVAWMWMNQIVKWNYPTSTRWRYFSCFTKIVTRINSKMQKLYPEFFWQIFGHFLPRKKLFKVLFSLCYLPLWFDNTGYDATLGILPVGRQLCRLSHFWYSSFACAALSPKPVLPLVCVWQIYISVFSKQTSEACSMHLSWPKLPK